MSLIIKNVEVADYISIGNASLEVSSGIFLVTGENQDKEGQAEVSNGAGKTTIFTALYQGLYNKSVKDPKASIDDVNNSYTGRPYKIRIELVQDGTPYIIINDRTTRQISITRDGENITPKGVAAQLLLLRDIIGFDFNTFSSLTFLNTKSLHSVMDVTSKNNILYEFFNLGALDALEKRVKARRKESNTQREVITRQLSMLSAQLATIMPLGEGTRLRAVEDIEKDITTLDREVVSIGKEWDSFEAGDDCVDLTKLLEVSALLEKEKGLIIRDGKQKSSMVSSFKKGECPTCAQKMPEPPKSLLKEVETLTARYKEIVVKLKDTESKISTLTTAVQEARKHYTDTMSAAKTSLMTLKAELEAAKRVSTATESTEGTRQLIEKQKKALEAELPSVEEDIQACEALIALFKSGAIVNGFLRQYRDLFLENFKALSAHTAFNIGVRIRVAKGKMTYIFEDEGKDKSFSMLSAGEQTRVSLLLLLATTKTVEQLSNITVNYLVLDELLGVLDEEGIDFLKGVLATMRTSKSIYIISHHQEIEDSFADGVVHVVKRDNISTVKKETYE